MRQGQDLDWRVFWDVDLETATATHVDGWAFQFAPAEDDSSAFDGRIIRQPDPLLPHHLQSAARIAREAGDAFVEARQRRH